MFLPNLKGYMVGNGVTHYKYDGEPAWHEFAYWSGLISQDLYDDFKQCNYTYFNFIKKDLSDYCKSLLTLLDNITAQVNPYDVFGICYSDTATLFNEPTKMSGLMKVGNEIKAYKKYFTVSDYTPFTRRAMMEQE